MFCELHFQKLNFHFKVMQNGFKVQTGYKLNASFWKEQKKSRKIFLPTKLSNLGLYFIWIKELYNNLYYLILPAKFPD